MGELKNNEEFVGTAFLSCSLREEDRSFIELIERILLTHKIKPFGTVGRHSAAPLNIPEHMKINIPKADFVVIAATPRYFQRDMHTGQNSNGLSEMVHVETGMAYMANKPVVVFVKEGTNVGNFLPSITEYIVLNEQRDDLKKKWKLINSLIENAYQIVHSIKKPEATPISFKGVLTTGLAILGGIKLLEFLSSDE
ncbi:MAG: hypothetical protein JXQ93_04890 [Flavobacteriaceae bacterium]